MKVTLKQKDGQSVYAHGTEIMWIKKMSERCPDSSLKKTFCRKYNVFLEELKKVLSF